MERVLITGASGFVGFHLIEAALKNNLEVFAAVRESSDVAQLKQFYIQYTYPNFENVDSLIKELEEKQYTYIIHAAGTTKAKTAEAYNLVNADYTYNLALAITKANIRLKKFVFISSLAALGPAQLGEIIEDNKPHSPVSAYGLSKSFAEQKLALLTSFPLITIRPTAVYGPRDKDIYILLKKISQGIEPYLGKIDQQLSFVYVKDLAAVTIQALFSNVTHNAYNISDGNAYDRYELADLTKLILHKKTIKMHLPLLLVRILANILAYLYGNRKDTPALNPEKLGELTAPNWACSIEHAKTDLGYLPKYNLHLGLTETLKWYQKNGLI